MNIFTQSFAFNADVFTPVERYLSLRNHFGNACLLESNDYHDRSDSTSFIGLEPIIEIQLIDTIVHIKSEVYPTIPKSIPLTKESSINNQLERILASIQFDTKSKFNGFFGRFGFEFALLTEDHILKQKSSLGIPDMHLFVFKYVLIIDHFKDEGIFLKNSTQADPISEEEINFILSKKAVTHLPFEKRDEEKSEFSNTEYEVIVAKAQEHCLRGDVFQLVLSNSFSQKFFGDDFAVYRQLRRLNPSPYLFYFDFGYYRLFGSSPEAQLKISKGIAEIHPIAGTVVKTGVSEIDLGNVAFLKQDEKENAEHTMLVDLARNDLSKNCTNVRVTNYKEIQEFSHVYHIVSKVTGVLKENLPFTPFNESFPAGTLSGSPKPKALELIAHYEKSTRDFYGGAIGIIASNGDLNLAIVIRSLLSKNNHLYYRAGAGIVLDSIPKNECAEVHNKLRAVKTAIEYASNTQNKSL